MILVVLFDVICLRLDGGVVDGERWRETLM